jgi:hypothetical protein
MLCVLVQLIGAFRVVRTNIKILLTRLLETSCDAFIKSGSRDKVNQGENNNHFWDSISIEQHFLFFTLNQVFRLAKIKINYQWLNVF